jgi:hypothetical protein
LLGSRDTGCPTNRTSLTWSQCCGSRSGIRDPGAFLTLDPRSWISDPGSSIPDPGSRIPDLGSRVSDPRSQIPDLGPGTRIPELGSRISDPVSDPDFQTHISDSLLTVLRIRIPDPGSQTHIIEGLVTIFWVKTSIILGKLGQIFFFSISKIK